MFQVNVSVKALCLYDVTWLNADVHMLMSCMSITYLDHLVLGATCQLRSSLSPASPSSLVKVDKVEIYTSLSINTLTSLLSHMEYTKLIFLSGCQVLDMDVNTTPPPQVSQGHLYQIQHGNIKPLNVTLN